MSLHKEIEFENDIERIRPLLVTSNGTMLKYYL